MSLGRGCDVAPAVAAGFQKPTEHAAGIDVVGELPAVDLFVLSAFPGFEDPGLGAAEADVAPSRRPQRPFQRWGRGHMMSA
jgi:hypothetical protein